jgi:hypothetical protein
MECSLVPIRLTHNLAIESTRDESARQGFATGMREYVLGQLAGHMQTVYQKRVLPSFVRSTGSYPKDGQAVHKLMKPDLLFIPQ